MSFWRRAAGWFDSRRRVTVGAFAAWMLVAAASTGSSSSNPGWVGVPDLSTVLIALFAAFMALSVAAYVYLLRGERPEREAPPRRPARYWMIALVCIAIVVALRSLSDDIDARDAAEENVTDVGTTARPESDPSSGDSVPRDVDQTEIIAAALLAGLAAAAWLALRRTHPEAETTLGPAPLVEPVIDRAIAQLDLGDDPRSAILAAYATLEGALADGGLSRRPNETAAEHLERTVGSVSADPTELRELGGLYERARFSSEAPTVSDRARARTILDGARLHLRRPEAERARADR